MSYEFQQFHIPDRMMGGIRLYIEAGVEPGSFLAAIICNDLREAVERGDNENIANIPAYVSYFYNFAPSQCWGSTEKMEAWLAEFQAPA